MKIESVGSEAGVAVKGSKVEALTGTLFTKVESDLWSDGKVCEVESSQCFFCVGITGIYLL